MNATPSIRQLNILAAIFIGGIQSAKKDIEDKESMLIITQLPIFPDELKDKVKDLEETMLCSRESLDELLSTRSYCLESIPGFSAVYEVVEKFDQLAKDFRKAKSWSDEELSAMKAMHDYHQKHKDLLPCAGESQYEAYLKARDEKLAKRA